MNWKTLASEFVGTWYSEENLRKIYTIIKGFEDKPKVTIHGNFSNSFRHGSILKH
jgi:hypothetical protein